MVITKTQKHKVQTAANQESKIKAQEAQGMQGESTEHKQRETQSLYGQMKTQLLTLQ